MRGGQRHVSNEEISEALNHPWKVLDSDVPGRKKYVGPPRSDGNRVVVIASHPPRLGQVTIVTCYTKSASAPV